MMKSSKWKIAMYAGVLVISMLVLGLSSGYQQDKPCQDLRVILKNEVDNQFLDLETVKNSVRQTFGSPLKDSPLGEISVTEIERNLRDNPYIRDAEVYKDISGYLIVEATLRKPLARVYDNSGNGFYLDQEFYKVPLSAKFSANTLLVRGDFTETVDPPDTLNSVALAGLQDLLRYIDNDDFRRSLFSELVVDAKGDITLYPEVGDIPVRFGKAEDIEVKFEKLVTFYRQVLNRVGWNKYKSIDLRFREQVVAQRSG